MSYFQPVSQSDFIRELQRLHAAQLRAASEDERLHADEAFADFLRMNAKGKTRDWFDARKAASGDQD